MKYIKNKDFIKLTKKQKLSLPEYLIFEEHEIDNLVLIPTRQKYNGYNTGVFIAYTEGKGWWKPMRCDVFSIRFDFDDHVSDRTVSLWGDFENDGVQLFQLGNKKYKATIQYGGQIVIKKVS